MALTKKALLFWSSGKDSAMAYQRLIAEGYRISALVTTLSSDGIVPYHEVASSYVQAQARAMGLPLWRLPLPHPCPNILYEGLIGELLQQARQQGFTHVAFGDLFLDDIRDYRTKIVEKAGLQPIFPIWIGEPSASSTYALQVLQSGIKALLTAVNSLKLPATIVGRNYDRTFLELLPPDVDPAGEYGEFHTFVYEAPFFGMPVRPPMPLPAP
jgi:uncharacterized protein (TIGR00290 family)